MIKKIDIVQIERYTGTPDSVKKLISRLMIDKNDYEFDKKTKWLFINSNRSIYKPGDFYQYIVNRIIEEK